MKEGDWEITYLEDINHEKAVTPETHLPEAYTIDVDLTPLANLYDQIVNMEDVTQLPEIPVSDIPSYAYLDEIYEREGAMSLAFTQESRIYDHLVYTISKMDLGGGNEDFSRYCGDAILQLQAQAYTKLKYHFEKIDYRDALRHGTDDVLKEAKPDYLWGEALDVATMDFLESIKNFGGKKATFEKNIVQIPEENIKLDTQRLIVEGTKIEALGGNAEQFEKYMQQEIDNVKVFFSAINLAKDNSIASVSIYPPELELVYKWGRAYAYATKSPETHIAVSAFNPETKQLLNDQFSNPRLINMKEYIGHELVHAFTRETLPVEYLEALAVLYQMFNSRNHEKNSIEGVFHKVGTIINKEDTLTFLDRMQRLADLEKQENKSQIASLEEIYSLPAAMLYVIFEIEPKACGELIRMIGKANLLDNEINLEQIFLALSEKTGADITPEIIEQKIRENIQKYKFTN